MTNKRRTINFKQGIPKPSAKWLVLTMFVSLFIHLISYVNLDRFGKGLEKSRFQGRSKVKVNVVSKPKKKPPSVLEAQRILEAKLEPTEKPKEAKFKGAQDHIAEKETRTKQRSALNDLDAGAGGESAKTSAQKQASKSEQKNQKANQKEASKEKAKTRQLFGDSNVLAPSKKSKYQALLPSVADLSKQVQAGYQDYIDEEVEIGERVDFNTTSYRYIGYFTNLRKGFSQTWIYPSEAVKRGLQGQVRIEFTIDRDGQLNRVKVLETSGHKILDDAVVDAIRLSSPYPPLPEDHEKDRLTVVASFVYTLRGYAF